MWTFLNDLNPVELKYYPFMINLDKCSGYCNSVNDRKKKTNRNEIKTLIKHIPCDCECKLNSSTCNSNKKCDIQT